MGQASHELQDRAKIAQAHVETRLQRRDLAPSESTRLEAVCPSNCTLACSPAAISVRSSG